MRKALFVWTLCGKNQAPQESRFIANKKLYIHFVSNNLDAGRGFMIAYFQVTGQLTIICI